MGNQRKFAANLMAMLIDPFLLSLILLFKMRTLVTPLEFAGGHTSQSTWKKVECQETIDDK